MLSLVMIKRISMYDTFLRKLYKSCTTVSCRLYGILTVHLELEQYYYLLLTCPENTYKFLLILSYFSQSNMMLERFKFKINVFCYPTFTCGYVCVVVEFLKIIIIHNQLYRAITTCD